MKKLFLQANLLMLIILLSSCSKNSDDNTINHGLSGTLYFEFGGKASSYRLQTDTYTEGLSKMGTYSSIYDDFDVSWDNQKILFTQEAHTNNRFFTYQRLEHFLNYTEHTNTANNLFKFRIQWNSINEVSAYISPNEQFIAIAAQTAIGMPILVVSTDPNDADIIKLMPQNGSLPHYGSPIWTQNNHLYYRMGTFLCKSTPDDKYKSVQPLFEVGSATNVSISPDGTKVVFRKNKHLWLCNSDGSGLTQITTSETSDKKQYDGESNPTFSPDGNYIAFQSENVRGASWSDTGIGGSGTSVTGSSFGYLTIIPADGKLYNLDTKNNGAIYLKKENGAFGIPTESNIIWR
ncbi:DPP IV N-terminal domain-containing protein [Capnocytophaga sp.]|uniref:TolB family protein n=1 Tax=Capnocytophaga sp. TaxID=44737 RepID=UPI0026DD4184|nr:DPP IV N-terminal domain-containing protein [Capnocytophaga sp.]MDO5105591.1 DPP IV N-terminal domain-containing protein [Capnocytophaga sp.]